MENNKYNQSLKDARARKGLSIDQAATQAGLSVSSLRALEQGHRNLTVKNIYVLMKVYGTDANELLNVKKKHFSFDEAIATVPEDKRDFLMESFKYMISQAGGEV